MQSAEEFGSILTGSFLRMSSLSCGMPFMSYSAQLQGLDMVLKFFRMECLNIDEVPDMTGCRGLHEMHPA